MGKTIGISEYDKQRIESYLKFGIRSSRAQIVHEALIRYYPSLDREAEMWFEFKEKKNEKYQEGVNFE